jgi:hypothetical protein
MSFGVLLFMFDDIQTRFGDGAWFSWFFSRLCDGDASMLLQGRWGDSYERKING